MPGSREKLSAYLLSAAGHVKIHRTLSGLSSNKLVKHFKQRMHGFLVVDLVQEKEQLIFEQREQVGQGFAVDRPLCHQYGRAQQDPSDGNWY